MNLRENKMDSFDTGKKKTSFFGNKKRQPKLAPAPERKKIDPVKNIKKLEASGIGRQKWMRKDPKPPLPEEQIDYQETYEYEREYSQYLEQNKENVVVHWRGPEFEHYPKDKKWYTTALIILALIILYAVFKGSVIMALVFFLIGVVGYLILSRPQKVIDFGVTYDGILVGDEIYDFDEIKSFWIFYEPPHTRVISLHMRGHLRPYLHIPLHQVDPVIVHKALTDFIPEEKQEQNMIDILERLLRM